MKYFEVFGGYGTPEDLQREFDRFFEHLGQGKRPMVVFGPNAWIPAIDVYETIDEVVVVVDLAGVTDHDVEAIVENDVLTVRGVRGDQRRGQRQMYHVMEISYGPFERKIRLPAKVNTESAKATCQDGFLELVFVKAEEPKPRTVKVQIP